MLGRFHYLRVGTVQNNIDIVNDSLNLPLYRETGSSIFVEPNTPKLDGNWHGNVFLCRE